MLQLAFVSICAWLLGVVVGYGPNMRTKTPNPARDNAHGREPISGFIETHSLPNFQPLGLGLDKWGHDDSTEHKYRTEAHGQIRNEDAYLSLVEAATRVRAMSRHELDPMTHVSLTEKTHHRDSEGPLDHHWTTDCSGERSLDKVACEMTHALDSEEVDCSEGHSQGKVACNPPAQLPSSSPPPRQPCWFHQCFILQPLERCQQIHCHIFICIALGFCFALMWRCWRPRAPAPDEPEWHVPVKRISYRLSDSFAESPSKAPTTASEQVESPAEYFDIGDGDVETDSEATCSMYGMSPVCQQRDLPQP